MWREKFIDTLYGQMINEQKCRRLTLFQAFPKWRILIKHLSHSSDAWQRPKQTSRITRSLTKSCIYSRSSITPAPALTCNHIFILYICLYLWPYQHLGLFSRSKYFKRTNNSKTVIMKNNCQPTHININTTFTRDDSSYTREQVWNRLEWKINRLE